MTPAGTSNELDVQNEWEENTHTHGIPPVVERSFFLFLVFVFFLLVLFFLRSVNYGTANNTNKQPRRLIGRKNKDKKEDKS